MNSFLKALSGDKSTIEKIGTATNNDDSVVVDSDAENNIVVIHSLSNLGGNLLRPTGQHRRTRWNGQQANWGFNHHQQLLQQVKLNTPGLEKYKPC